MHAPTMKSTTLFVCLLAACIIPSFAAAGGGPSLPPDIIRRIDTADGRRILSHLASDFFKGRDTPSTGLDSAARYIIEELRSAGLEPVNGSYIHNYVLERVDLDTPCTARMVVDGAVQDFAIKTDFVPFEQTGAAAVSSNKVVFAGFGITAQEYAYDDYAGLDAKGAIVVIVRGEPEHPTDTTWFNGKRWTRYSPSREKVRNAKAHGAAALLMIDAARLRKKLTVSGFPWPSLFPKMKAEALPLTLPEEPGKAIPVLHVGDNVINSLFGSVASLMDRVIGIDSTKTPASFRADGPTISIDVRLRRDTVRARNIVSYVRGSEMPDEYVIMGAHYDHIGVSNDSTKEDRIYNGADDNGSGTTGLLLAAKAIARSSVKPKRSMLFIHFSGEEKGLLGSKAYARTPLLPLDKCVAMINTDMIGRCVDNKLSIGGNTRCPDLARINEEENGRLDKPFNLAYDIESYFFRSDQASFAMKKIPVIFYFTGEHEDYHKLTDEVAKIDFDSMIGIVRLAASTAWRAADIPRTSYVPAGGED
ncbi:MAG: M28 family peptidase [Candidatus Kapabacteria bacterium]|nr:M28 family peptidase [Candidatus Kapabacteria bacterium]